MGACSRTTKGCSSRTPVPLIALLISLRKKQDSKHANHTNNGRTVSRLLGAPHVCGSSSKCAAAVTQKAIEYDARRSHAGERKLLDQRLVGCRASPDPIGVGRRIQSHHRSLTPSPLRTYILRQSCSRVPPVRVRVHYLECLLRVRFGSGGPGRLRT